MLFSESWLRSFIDIPLNSQQLAHTLTMAGLEVESFQSVAPQFSGIVVAEVLTVQPHSNAERLSVCTVNVGEQEPLQIVCGAKNVKPGIKVPCAMIGAQLPGDFAIKKTKLRGIESYGMLCSAKELGLNDDVDGLLVLPESFVVGQSIREALELDDHCFILKITPNRADCLSMQGIAREIAALMDTTYFNKNTPTTTIDLRALPTALPVRVEAQSTPHFLLTTIENIDNTCPTPLWMRQRLERAGLRCINLIVDITNYVMLEYGQPLHAYDAQKVDRASMHVRPSQTNESLVLLNQDTATLDSKTLVIADQSGILALAGVMGGYQSGVSSSTTTILLESAYWHPHSVSGKTRQYNLSSEAAHRFERGVDPNGIEHAAQRATQLIIELAGGKATSFSEHHTLENLPSIPQILLRHARTQRLLGINIEPLKIQHILTLLGCTFHIEDQQEAIWKVTPPSWRIDLEKEVDLIEEIARIVGYDHIKATPPTPSLTFLPSPELFSVSSLKSRCIENDYQEVISYSFVSDTIEHQLNPDQKALPLLNPIAQTMNVMRTTLWSGLLPALQNNVRRKIERVRLFEIGRVFHTLQQQPMYFAGIAYGTRLPEQWGDTRHNIDIFDVKADLESIFRAKLLATKLKHHPALHPGRSAAIYLDNNEAGIIGELHPQLVKAFGLTSAPILFEIALDQALQAQPLPSFIPLSDLPVVRRDLALVAPQDLPAQQVLDVIQQSGLRALQEVTLFDVFEGGNLEPHLKSLAVRLQWQPEDHTLTEAEIQADIQIALNELNRCLKVVLRN